MGVHHGNRANAVHREPWNKGKIVGQKAPFKLKDIWALRVRLQMEGRVRELALFNLGIDSKLRGCDLVGLRVRDICHGDQVASRAIVMQHKTQRPVQFEITPATRDAVQKWIKQAGLKAETTCSRAASTSRPIWGPGSTRGSLGWVEELGLDPRGLRHALDAANQGDADLSAHEEPARRATAARPLQARITVRYLGIEVDDALEISEQTEI